MFHQGKALRSVTLSGSQKDSAARSFRVILQEGALGLARAQQPGALWPKPESITQTLQQQACSEGVGRVQCRMIMKAVSSRVHRMCCRWSAQSFSSAACLCSFSSLNSGLTVLSGFILPSLSESFFMVKGAALFLQQGNSPQSQRSLQHPHKHAGKLRFLPWNLFSVRWGRLPLPGVSKWLVFKARGVVEHRLVTAGAK